MQKYKNIINPTTGKLQRIVSSEYIISEMTKDPILQLALSEVFVAIVEKTSLEDVKNDSEISDVIATRHSNELDHDGDIQSMLLVEKTSLVEVKNDLEISHAIACRHAHERDKEIILYSENKKWKLTIDDLGELNITEEV